MIFISYSKRDAEITNKIVQYLHQHDIQIWTDKSLKAGDDWATAIDNAIDDASAGILILSASSANSTYVTQEYSRLMGQNKRLYVIKVDDLPIDEIHTRLRRLNFIDITQNFEDGMQGLVTSIKNSTILEGDTLQKSLSDELSDDVVLQVDFQNTDTEKVVDVIKGLLDKGVRSIRIKNG